MSADISRPEGAYASLIPYPERGLIGSTDLVKLERVNGDCSISEIMVTLEEASSLIQQLRALGIA
jgi:cob(I)alamin adenosyltransferase